MSTYHNVALSAGSGLNTATEIGIPGANLDTYTSGMTPINLQGISNPIVGFSASLPWDRGETTLDRASRSPSCRETTRSSSAATTGTTATTCCRRRIRAGRAASSPSTRARPAARPTPRRRPTSTTRSRRSCSIVRAPAAVTSRSSTSRARSTRRCSLHPRQVAGVAEAHRRPGAAARVLHAARRHPDAGRAVQLRSGHQHAAGLGLRRRRGQPRRQVQLAQLQPAPRPVLALRRQAGGARRLRHRARSRSATTPTPSTSRSSRTTSSTRPTRSSRRPACRWRRASRRRSWPTSRERHHRCRRRRAPAQRRLRLLPVGPEGRQIHSWNVAFQREMAATSRPKWPTSATMARTSSSAST